MKLINKLKCKKNLLILSVLMLASCGNTSEIDPKTTYKVDFSLNTPSGIVTTEHAAQYVKYNGLVEKPTVTVTSENTNNYRIEGWYTDSAYASDTLWDFDVYTVKNNMTLYAKWTEMYSVKFYLEGNYDTPVYETLVKPNHKVNNCDDKVAGYKIDGYYTSKTFENNRQFDFNTPVTGHMALYLKTDGLLYFAASTMKKNFTPVAASISGSIVGNTTLVTSNGEEALQVNFGYSARANNGNSDPHLLFAGGNISILKSQTVNIKMKNLGPAAQIGFYFVGKDSYGNYVGGEDFTSTNSLYYNFKSNEINMKDSDSWIDVSFELAKETENWTKIDTLTKIRIESTYASKDAKDTSNVFLLKEITSKNVPSYDTRNPRLSFFDNENEIYTTRINKNSLLTKETATSMCAGYKIRNFYSNASKTQQFDFTQAISADTKIYIDYEDTLYFDGKAIAARFDMISSNDDGKKDFAPTKGTIQYNEQYDAADINFGRSTIADPYAYISECYIPVNNKTIIEITVKNLGNCNQVALYWAGVTSSGSTISDFKESYEYWSPQNLQCNMQITDDFVTYNFDLSSVSKWKEMKAITKLRVQAAYVSTSKDDLSNRMMIKSISGR